MAKQIDFTEAYFLAGSLNPPHERCEFVLDLTLKLGAAVINLTGATVRWAMFKEDGVTLVAGYDFESIHGGSTNAHLTFVDASNGKIRLTLGVGDTAAADIYRYELFWKAPGGTRRLVLRGRFDILPATPPTAAVDANV